MADDNEVKEKLKAFFIECSEVSERVKEPPPSLQDFLSKCLANSDLKSRITLPLKVIGYFYSSLCSKFFQRSCQQAISDRLNIYVSHIRRKLAMGVPGYEPILSVYDSFIGEYRAEKKFFVKPLLFFVPYFLLISISFDEKNRNLFFNLVINFLENKTIFFNTIKSGLTPYMVGITLFIYSLLYGFLYCVSKSIEPEYMRRMLKLYKTHSLFDVIYMLYGKHEIKVIREGKSSEFEQIEQDLDRMLQMNRRKPTDFEFIIVTYIPTMSLICIIIVFYSYLQWFLSFKNRFIIIENLPFLAIIFASFLIILGYSFLIFRNAIISLNTRREKRKNWSL